VVKNTVSRPTFFITEFSFRTNKRIILTWDQMRIAPDGFEIAITRRHLSVTARSHQLTDRSGHQRPLRQRSTGSRLISFAYPGNAIDPGRLPILQRLGIRFARRGGRGTAIRRRGGFAFEPARISAVIPRRGARPTDFVISKRAVQQARMEDRVRHSTACRTTSIRGSIRPPGCSPQFLDYLIATAIGSSLSGTGPFYEPGLERRPMAVIEEKRKTAAHRAW